MKKFTILFLAAFAVSLMIYAGIDGLLNHYATGPFFTFVGSCTAIGLSIDIIKHIRQRIQKNKLRRLGW